MISKDDEMARKSLGYKWGKPTPRPSFRPSSGRWTWGGGYGREPRPRPGRDIDPGFSIDTPRPSYDIDPGFSIDTPRPSYDIDPGFSDWYDIDPGHSPPRPREPWNDIDPGHSPDFDDPNAPPWGNPVPRGGGRTFREPNIIPATDIYYPDRDTEPYPGANDRLNALLNPTGAPLNTRWRGNMALETYQGDRGGFPLAQVPVGDENKRLDEGDYEALRPGFDRINTEMNTMAQDRLNRAVAEEQTGQDQAMANQGYTQKVISPEEEELANVYNLSGGGDPYYGGTPNSRRRNTLQAPNDTSRIDPNYWVQPDYMDFGVPPGPTGQPSSTGRYSGEAQGYDDYWRRR